MTEIHLSPDLVLPVDAVTQKLAWLGRTGSGKTYGASKLAEEMLAADAQVVILDAVGVWYGLRLAADGKGKGIEIPVFGGLHGDVPLEPTGGALMANLIVDRGISVVLDVSQFETDAAKARFAHEWGDRFFFRKKAAPSAVHLFIEECQEFVPQNPQRGEERMLHAFQRIEKLGRNFGIGVSLISQRPQEVNKKALNQTECLFVFQMTGTQERKAIEAWVADKDLKEDVGDLLPHLEIGQAHVWSPQWLKVSKTVRIAKKRTFNASSTPTVGKQAASRELAPIDLARIRKDMAATIERAKAEDPRHLHKTIAELRAEIRKLETAKPAAAVKAGKPPKPPKPAIGEADAKRFEAAIDRLLKEMARMADQVAQRQQVVVAEVGNLRKEISAAVAATTNARSALATASGGHRGPAVGSAVTAGGGGRAGTLRAPGPSRPSPVVPRAARTDRGPSGAEQRILDALAELQVLGVPQPERVQVAFLAGYTHLQSKGLVNGLSALRTAGLLDYPSTGTVCLTDAGLERATWTDAPRTSKELQARVIQLLEGAVARVLQPLIDAYPQPMERTAVAEAAGYGHLQSKGFVNSLSRLRSLGFIDYPSTGLAVAKPVLFIGKE